MIYGARRVGKTTLINNYLKDSLLKYKFISGDSHIVKEVLGSDNIEQIQEYCEGYELLVIDEAQNIPNIGQGLKLIVDHIPNIRVIATGSSSFDLANKIGEPLVGRKITIMLYPLSLYELQDHYNQFELKENLAYFLRFGMYPEILTDNSILGKQNYFREIAESYLYKDILDFNYAKRPDIILKLLKLLAFQISNEISLNELASELKVDIKTVDKYLYLLEKSFIIHRLSSFSRNLRNELSNKKNIIFMIWV